MHFGRARCKARRGRHLPFSGSDVRQAAEYYRDVLGFSLDPVDGVFQPSPDEPGGVYAIVKRAGVWIHFQIRRADSPRPPRVEDLNGYTLAFGEPGR